MVLARIRAGGMVLQRHAAREHARHGHGRGKWKMLAQGVSPNTRMSNWSHDDGIRRRMLQETLSSGLGVCIDEGGSAGAEPGLMMWREQEIAVNATRRLSS